MNPNFLYIGPDKSGSTWIYNILLQHPECYVPIIKDIYFFDKFYDKGIDWYLSFFRSASANIKAVGELSHDYLYSKEAAERIYSHYPKINLITCLRNPIDRTFSNYLFLKRSGITKLSFKDAIKKYPSLISRSLYYKHLSIYFDIFDYDQIKILFFDELVNNPSKFAEDLFKALSLSINSQIDYDKKVLPASEARNYYLAKVAKYSAKVIRESGYSNFLGKLKNSSLTGLLYKNYNKKNKPTLDDISRLELIDVFKSDVNNLSVILKTDLSRWLS